MHLDELANFPQQLNCHPIGLTDFSLPDKAFQHIHDSQHRHMNGFGHHKMPYLYLCADNQTVYFADLKTKRVIKALDFSGFYGAASLGHTPLQLLPAIEAQLKSGCFVSSEYDSVTRNRLLKYLIGETGLWREYFSDDDFHITARSTGSEAVTVALQLAFEYQWDYLARKSKQPHKNIILAFEGAYHGSTVMAKTVLNRTSLTLGQPQANIETIFIPYGDDKKLKNTFKAAGAKIAAVIVEPIQGDGGIVIPPHGFLSSIQKQCSDYGSVMIADETLTFSRTGKWFASFDDGQFVEPDITVIGKSLGMGVTPIAMVIAKKQITWHPYRGISTFELHPMACAVVQAGLAWIDTQQLLTKADELGRQLLESIRPNEVIKAIRGQGLMVGLELTDSASRHFHQIRCDLLSQGVVTDIMSGNKKQGINKTLRLSPPLVVSKKDCEEVVERLNQLR